MVSCIFLLLSFMFQSGSVVYRSVDCNDSYAFSSLDALNRSVLQEVSNTSKMDLTDWLNEDAISVYLFTVLQFIFELIGLNRLCHQI